MSDERFFSQVKSTLDGYAPAVPQEVYSGMRRRLWMSRFTSMNASRFNMWYVLLLVGIGSGIAAWNYNGNAMADQGIASPVQTTFSVSAVSQPDMSSSAITASSCSGATATCCSKNAGSSHQASCNSHVNGNDHSATSAQASVTTSATPAITSSGEENAAAVDNTSTEANETVIPVPVVDETKASKPKKSKGDKAMPVNVWKGETSTQQ